ncbi:hypothetical protein Salat_1126300 [Sesamum alatum]|uniref:Uncharacterized protein n=1 Tax=Sesamum alatum TaxID=300844 RepID=A0AAE2CN33_9LAMI|nr:hypothetical protein Salat_1126300 [Sesamum alatum]
MSYVFGTNERKGNGFKKKIEKLERRLLKLRQGHITTESRLEEARLFIEELTIRKESYWKQIGKRHCLQLGDKNTIFFHAAADKSRKNNMIRKLKGENNQFIEGTDGLQ